MYTPFYLIIILLSKSREVQKRIGCSWSADKKRSSRFGSTEKVTKPCNKKMLVVGCDASLLI